MCPCFYQLSRSALELVWKLHFDFGRLNWTLFRAYRLVFALNPSSCYVQQNLAFLERTGIDFSINGDQLIKLVVIRSLARRGKELSKWPGFDLCVRGKH